MVRFCTPTVDAVGKQRGTDMRIGTCHFVSFTKACDYYRDQGNEGLAPAELEREVRRMIAGGDIAIGKPDVPVGGRLVLIDGGTRYAIEEA
jgi:hypothetical protein